MSASRASATVRGLLALAVLVVLTIGVPLWLRQVSGTPIPDTVPSWGQAWGALTSRDDGTLLLGVLKYAAWGGWALFVTSVIADLAARLRGLPAPRLGPQQHLASQLIGAVTALAVALPTAGTAVAASVSSTSHAVVASAPTAGHLSVGLPSTWRVALTGPEARPSADLLDVASFTKYTVRPGDCLWDIAWNELGDPERWPELFEASRHIRQPSGHRITDPDHIEPGWIVLIPSTHVEHERLPAPAPAHPPAGHSPSEAVITPLTMTPGKKDEGPGEGRRHAPPSTATSPLAAPLSTSDPSERISTPLSMHPGSHPQVALRDADWSAAIAQHDRTANGPTDWRARLAPNSP